MKSPGWIRPQVSKSSTLTQEQIGKVCSFVYAFLEKGEPYETYKKTPVVTAFNAGDDLEPAADCGFCRVEHGFRPQNYRNQAYWSTRLLANGTPYSYRPPLVDGKLVYCMDSGLDIIYATPSYLVATWTSGTGADADAVLQSAVTKTAASGEMDAATVEASNG